MSGLRRTTSTIILGLSSTGNTVVQANCYNIRQLSQSGLSGYFHSIWPLCTCVYKNLICQRFIISSQNLKNESTLSYWNIIVQGNKISIIFFSQKLFFIDIKIIYPIYSIINSLKLDYVWWTALSRKYFIYKWSNSRS